VATHPGEDEQLEALKKWWSENGTVTIIGFIIGIAVLFGGRAWFDHKQLSSEAASAELALLLNELNVGDDASITEKADGVLGEYGGNSQAGFASLIKAKALVGLGERDKAKNVLQSIIDKPAIDGIDQLARLRLARLLFAQLSYDVALLLISEDGNAFEPHYQALRGDIYLAQGDVAKAREAYQSALVDPSALANGQQLRMKLDSLGEDHGAHDSEMGEAEEDSQSGESS